MGVLQVSALILSYLSLGLLFTSTATDHWVESDIDHTGLWRLCKSTGCQPLGNKVLDYVQVTRVFLLLGLSSGFCSVFWLSISFRIRFFGTLLSTRIASIAGFVAGLATLTAMGIFTGVYIQVYSAKTDTTFGWSFFLGWISGPLFFLTGGLAFGVRPPVTRVPSRAPSRAPSSISRPVSRSPSIAAKPSTIGKTVSSTPSAMDKKAPKAPAGGLAAAEQPTEVF